MTTLFTPALSTSMMYPAVPVLCSFPGRVDEVVRSHGLREGIGPREVTLIRSSAAGRPRAGIAVVLVVRVVGADVGAAHDTWCVAPVEVGVAVTWGHVAVDLEPADHARRRRAGRRDGGGRPGWGDDRDEARREDDRPQQRPDIPTAGLMRQAWAGRSGVPWTMLCSRTPPAEAGAMHQAYPRRRRRTPERVVIYGGARETDSGAYRGLNWSFCQHSGAKRACHSRRGHGPGSPRSPANAAAHPAYADSGVRLHVVRDGDAR